LPTIDEGEGGDISPSVDSWRLRSVERASTTEQVLTELRDAIVDGRIPQGEPLREAHLARQLGTGRSAVREAIRQLVQEGLVDHELHRGSLVRVMSLADYPDVYGAREVIEVGAARRLLEREDGIDTAPLRDALEALREALDGEGRLSDEAIAADIRFHQELVRLCDSPRLTRAHDTLAAETRLLLRHHPLYPATDYVTDHERLLDALERRDPRTPDLIAQHLRLSSRLIGDELARETDTSAERPVA
jgi:DNA-binding GntR family transcriptional regulator